MGSEMCIRDSSRGDRSWVVSVDRLKPAFGFPSAPGSGSAAAASSVPPVSPSTPAAPSAPLRDAAAAPGFYPPLQDPEVCQGAPTSSVLRSGRVSRPPTRLDL